MVKLNPAKLFKLINIKFKVKIATVTFQISVNYITQIIGLEPGHLLLVDHIIIARNNY